MRQLLLFVFFAFIFASDAAAQSEAIKWEKDYKTALALSRETGKPILVDFWAKWCAPCLAMDRDFWTRKDVVEAVKSFVPLKLDYDIEKTLARQFAVRGLPYIAFADEYGNLVAYRRGFNSLKAEDLTQIYKDIPKDSKILKKHFEALEANKNDSAALLEIADYYAKHRMTMASEKYYRLAYETSESKQNAAKRTFIAERLAPILYAAENYPDVIPVAEDYLKSFPEAAERESFYRMLIDSYTKRGKVFAAEIYLDRLKKEFPTSKFIAEAARTIEKAKQSKDKKAN